jgi:hypothetical protein
VGNDPIAIWMIDIFFEQLTIFLAAGVALAQQLFTAKLVPFLLCAVRANLEGERVARFFRDAARSIG